MEPALRLSLRLWGPARSVARRHFCDLSSRHVKCGLYVFSRNQPLISIPRPGVDFRKFSSEKPDDVSPKNRKLLKRAGSRDPKLFQRGIQWVTKSGPRIIWSILQKGFYGTRWVVCRGGAGLLNFLQDPRGCSQYMWQAFKDGCKHNWEWVKGGCRLLWVNLRISKRLIHRSFMGHALTRRERKLLVVTSNDMFKIVPFSLFFIIPFAELALPLALRIWPNLLPSTFFEKSYDNSTLARKLKAKKEMASFFQEVMDQKWKDEVAKTTSGDVSPDELRQKLSEFEAKLRAGYPTPKEVLVFGKLFGRQFSPEKLSDKQLVAIAKICNLNLAWTYRTYVMRELRRHVTKIRGEDREIMWEGVDSLTTEELIHACQERAIPYADTTKDEMREGLQRWLELSSHKDIQLSMLLWIQTFYLAGRADFPMEVAETIHKAVEWQPEDVKVDEIATDPERVVKAVVEDWQKGKKEECPPEAKKPEDEAKKPEEGALSRAARHLEQKIEGSQKVQKTNSVEEMVVTTEKLQKELEKLIEEDKRRQEQRDREDAEELDEDKVESKEEVAKEEEIRPDYQKETFKEDKEKEAAEEEEEEGNAEAPQELTREIKLTRALITDHLRFQEKEILRLKHVTGLQEDLLRQQLDLMHTLKAGFNSSSTIVDGKSLTDPAQQLERIMFDQHVRIHMQLSEFATGLKEVESAYSADHTDEDEERPSFRTKDLIRKLSKPVMKEEDDFTFIDRDDLPMEEPTKPTGL